MKSLLILVLSVISCVGLDIPITWNFPAGNQLTTVDTNGNVTYATYAGFNVYHGTTVTNMTKMGSVSSTNNNFYASNLTGGVHFFYVKTFDIFGLESVPSNWIKFDVVTNKVEGTKIKGITVATNYESQVKSLIPK